MRERPHTNRIPDELPLGASPPPQLDTPVIDMQDVEHRAAPETRVSNKGVKITPRLDPQDEEDAIVALEKIEKSLRGQLPG